MKFNIKRDLLVESLQEVVGPTTTKQNNPILNSILISTSNKKVRFATTDLDTSIISFRDAEIIEQGKIAIPMKRFFSLARELPPQDVVIEKVKNNLLVRCEKIEFKINTLNPEEFPQVKESKGVSLIKLNPQDTEEMIKLTSFCVGYEDVNYILGGVLFEVAENKIRLVSTDGKRLALCERSLPSNQPEVKTKISFILPIRAVSELYKLIKDGDSEIYMSAEENRVGFEFSETQFIARPIEGEFPDYSQYIPKEGKDKLVVKRKKILPALRRASLLSTADHQGVRLELKKDSVFIYKSTPQLGEVKEIIDADYSGGNLEVGFNPGYLIDVLKNLEDEDVVIDFFGADKPAVLRKPGYTYLLLPLKI